MNDYDHDDVQTFLTDYGAALSAGDLDTISDCYAYPALVVDDARSLLVPDPESVRDAFRSATRGYRDRGLVAAVAQITRLETTGAALLWVDVRWSYRDEYAREAAAESYRYLLRRGRDRFEICVVAPTDAGT
ncbi:hypothetical protein [Oerskovia flava]|uniref:hypothetical protein n=1 Tax=Oerskovia flava TaxID=2986422 RepID=UPI002240153A|nr:hypothetical protein [Oerskovia sp. JB1-3-2]